MKVVHGFVSSDAQFGPSVVHDHMGAIKSLSLNGYTMSFVNLIKLNLTQYSILENFYLKLELESNEVRMK